MFRAINLLIILVLSDLFGSAKLKTNDVDENLFTKICQLKFCRYNKRDCGLGFCDRLMMEEKKLGECLQNDRIRSINDTLCYNDCDGQDFRCAATQKCCWSGCNQTCQKAENLANWSSLAIPPIPENVTVFSNEKEVRRQAHICWEMSSLQNNTEFIIEGRVHVGNTFSIHKLSNWYVVNTDSLQVLDRLSNNFRIKTNLTLKIGRWYEYRVAAVNRNGIRGYSQTTIPFQSNEKPKQLPKPNNFSIDVAPTLLSNSSVYTRVAWKTPVSDYPIEKFEITWSLYINISIHESLLMEKALVPEKKRYFEFWNLEPNKYYYLQVHAISNFGRKQLTSAKECLLLNTTGAQ